MRKLLFILILFSATIQIKGQDLNYARALIDTLTSDAFQGRGYVREGALKASEFIRTQFDSLGLRSFEDNFFQEFVIAVNTFPGEIKMDINDKPLVPGQDFHVDPASPSITGTFKTLSISANELLNTELLKGRIRKGKGRLVILEDYDASLYSQEQNQKIREVKQILQRDPQIGLAGIIEITNQKLTWFGSTLQAPRPLIRIQKSSVPDEISEISLNIESEYKKDQSIRNVVGYIPGIKTDSVILVTAHYDHLGMMGEETVFPGANDNASGTALMLDMARHFSNEAPPYTIVFIAFGAEELGLLGSAYFVQYPLVRLSRIKFMLNFDIAGTGDDGIQVVNGSVFRKQFDLLTQINGDHQLLPQVRIRGEACNSDHCLFYRKGVPSFFIYTLGGIQAYHDIYDKGETLPLTNYEPYFQLLIKFIEKL